MDRPMFLIPIIILAAACAGAAVAPPEASVSSPPAVAERTTSPERVAAAGFDHGYATWDAVLRAHVDAKGMVNYAALGADAGLAKFVADLGAVAPEDVGGWSHDQQVAFYINAYNALTFQTIVDALPIKSIMDIKSRATDPHDPWETTKWRLAGRDVSLNWIEHTKLRANLNEPRVHFVLVCAAKGCPTLPGRAVLPLGLDEQLERFTAAFFTDGSKNSVEAGAGRIHMSRILDWYGDDFVAWSRTPTKPALDGHAAKEAAIVRLMSSHVSADDQTFIAAGRFTVVFNDYDWALNAQ